MWLSHEKVQIESKSSKQSECSTHLIDLAQVLLNYSWCPYWHPYNASTLHICRDRVGFAAKTGGRTVTLHQTMGPGTSEGHGLRMVAAGSLATIGSTYRSEKYKIQKCKELKRGRTNELGEDIRTNVFCTQHSVETWNITYMLVSNSMSTLFVMRHWAFVRTTYWEFLHGPIFS